MAQKKPKLRKVKANRYLTVGGGPVKELYLPWPRLDGTEAAQMTPEVVSFAKQGAYHRRPVDDRWDNPHGHRYIYEWIATP